MRPDQISTIDWLKYNGLFIAEHFLGHSFYSRLLSRVESGLISKIQHDLSLVKDLSPKRELIREFDSRISIKSIRSNSQVQVFRGAAKNWNCSRWDLDYFRNEYGQKEVTILNSDGLFEDEIQDFCVTSMEKYIDMLKMGSKVYLKFSPIVHNDSTLRKGFDLSWLEQFSFPGAFGRKFFLFIGGGNTLTPIHNALSNTVFIQIYGTKKWTFWEPSERFFLNVRANRRAYFFSQMRLQVPNPDDFPLAKYCTRFEVTLEPGDVLWFPAFYWHHVVNENNSIGVAYKTAHIPSAFHGSAVLLLLSFLSTKPFLLQSLIKSRFKDNERVFLD